MLFLYIARLLLVCSAHTAISSSLSSLSSLPPLLDCSRASGTNVCTPTAHTFSISSMALRVIFSASMLQSTKRKAHGSHTAPRSDQRAG